VNTDQTPVITPETARHVLHTFGAAGGWRPGTFTTRLLDLLAYADDDNAARLATAFPAEAAAVHLAKYEESGIAQLQRIAGSEAPTSP